MKNNWIALVSALGPRSIMSVLARKLVDVNHYYVMCRRVVYDSPAVRSRLDFSLNKASESDMEDIAEFMRDTDPASYMELLIRLQFYRDGFHDCYVARAPSGELAHIQWLVFPGDRAVNTRSFRRIYCPIGNGWVLMDNSFCFPRYRGLGLFPSVTARLMAIAGEAGCRSCVTYVRKDNLASLNEMTKLGFKFTKLIHELTFLGFRNTNL